MGRCAYLGEVSTVRYRQNVLAVADKGGAPQGSLETASWYCLLAFMLTCADLYITSTYPINYDV